MDISNTVVQFLISNSIQIVILIIAVVALIFSIRTFRLRERKRYKYEVRKGTNELYISDDIKPVLKAVLNNTLHHNKLLESMYSLEIFVVNSGNTDIIDSDYDIPLTFQIEQISEILGVTVVATWPRNIPVVPDQINAHEVTFKPRLLKSKDSFTLKVLMTQNVRVNAKVRIIGGIGGEQISLSRMRDFQSLTFSIVKIALPITLIILSFIIETFSSSISHKPTEQNIDIFFVIGISLVWLLNTLLLRPKNLLIVIYSVLLALIIPTIYILLHYLLLLGLTRIWH
jgi:hypothetical protein